MAPFAIVPVLDLKGGQVVHARAGDRARYQAIHTPLAAGSGPAAVLDGLLSLAPFRRVYIADIDAIEGRGDHHAVVADLARHCPAVEFWLDGGFADAEAAIAACAERVAPVLGSESLPDAAALEDAVRRLGRGNCVLSLDYRGERFVGPAAVEASAALWPDQVIAMTLSRVGSGAGPDTARLAQVQRVAGMRQVFAAGGVRDAGDIARLAAMGVAGALVASALHDGRLTRAALAPLMPESR
ncbi:MAG TPA: HisA/HisF-related TIM barrel protein [Stellaceae bacterium]|nr:HisA/HisF-related TIM barrel protein [Stellaceae bacterium]